MKSKLFTTHLPNFLEIQFSSFFWFLLYGLSYQLNSFPSIVDSGKNLEVRIYTNEFVLKRKKDLTSFECKQNNMTYGISIFVPIHIINRRNKKILIEKNAFIAQLPLMTNSGSFIVNGCERVIVNQIIRCPGLYYKIEKVKIGILPTITIIAQRGAWLKFELNHNGCWVRIDKDHKIAILDFLYGIGITDEEILFGIKHMSILYKYQNIQKKLKRTESEEFLSNEQLKILFSSIFTTKYYELGKIGRLMLNKRLNLNIDCSIESLTHQDILATLDYFLKLKSFLSDDTDDLKSRRIRSIGEVLENHFRIGLNRLERDLVGKIVIADKKGVIPSNIINKNYIISSIKEFFGSSQLSQYMDQTNPLAELSHKRRISAVGPGGLNAERVKGSARDLHPTQYGRICPVEAPEGKNVGLVGAFACYAKINYNGFIETPYFHVKNGKILYDKHLIYLTASEEENLRIASAEVEKNKDGWLTEDFVIARFNKEFSRTSSKDIDLISVSPIQVISIGAALIPFLEHDDANRALMGANMQRQAVPLLYPQKPIVGTGLELQIAADSGLVITAIKAGIVSFVSSNQIIIKNFEGTESIYVLNKYQNSNQETYINQKPIVWVGEEIMAGQIISDAAATEGGELALGQNLTIAYMPWEGYNYEDSIVISEKLLYDNLFTSIHIQTYDTEVKYQNIGLEKITITRDIPFVTPQEILYLDENGIILKGTAVQPDDILVGKVIPKTELDDFPEARLLKAIFGYKLPDFKDVSLRVPNGIFGRVIDIKFFEELQNFEVFGGNSFIRIFIAQIKKIRVGDKLAGRHGNKGVISKILPIQDMPFLPDGTIVDILLNPLGVPSRMNVGQIYECLLGFAADQLNKRYKILPFDEIYQAEASRVLINQKLREAAKKQNKPWLYNSYSPGKIFLFDGKTGKKFDNPILVGRSYILKLNHLVEDKIHGRSTGPYSLLTQQPVGGRSQNGGQRFGEMEVWALEAYGSAYTLQELLTIKSDDLEGRNKLLNSILCGKIRPRPNLPESFKVLLGQLKGLGLDIATYKLEKTKPNIIMETKVDLLKTYETRLY